MSANLDSSTGGSTASVSARAMQSIAALARSSASEVHFFREILSTIGEELDAFYAGVHLQLATESWEHDWNDGSVPATFWRPAVDDAINEALSETGAHGRLFRTRNSDQRIATLSTPMKDIHGARIGAIAVLVRCEREALEGNLQALQELVAFATECSGFVGQPSATSGEQASDSADDPVARALQRAGSYESSMELAYAITNQLQTKSGADVVALGEVVGRRVVVRVISGQDDVRHNAPGVIKIREALEECLDRGEPIVFQKGEDWSPDGKQEDHRLHRQWHESAGGDAVVSFPLVVDGEPKYIVGLRRGGSLQFRESELEKLRTLVEPYAPALELLRRAHRKFVAHGVENLRLQWQKMFSPGHLGRKVAAGAFLISLVWFLFGSMHYEITVPGRVLPAESRSFSAPEDGILSQVLVQPGDRVKEGQILCTFDDHALRLEEQRLITEERATSIELSQALAEEDRVAAQIARTQLDTLRSMQQLNQLQLAMTTLRAPFDGEITGGDLRERIGDRVVKGEPLFEVASNGGWRLELLVPESRIDGVERGLDGTFSAFARPEEDQRLAISEVAPSTSAEGGKNAFKVRADLSRHPIWLRAGMEGVARVDIGERRVSWVLLHDLFDWLHLKFWF